MDSIIINHTSQNQKSINQLSMFKNYFKTAWRNLWKNKVFSFINIVGLAAGMAVAMLIGLWIWSELSFNKDFKNYDRIAQVMQSQSINNSISNTAGITYSGCRRNAFKIWE